MKGNGNMKIAKKMSLLVASALLGVCVLVGFAEYQTAQVFESANYANINTVPSLIAIDEASEVLATLRVQAWQALAAPDRAQRATIEAKIADNRRRVDDALKKYEPLISDAKDKAMLEADRALTEQYDAVREKALALAASGQAAEGQQLLLNNQAVLTKLTDAFKQHRDYNVALGTKAAEEATAVRTTAVKVSIAAGAVTLLVVGFLGFFITRNIVRSMTQAVEAAERVARGDLDANVDSAAKDETGILLASLKTMIGRLRQLTAEIIRVSQEHELGNVDAALDVTAFEGQFRTLA